MADYIDKQKTIKTLKELIDAGAFDDDILFTICNTPSVDAVEVVRCRDCKHYFGDVCEMMFFKSNEDFFCKWGEKRMNINDALVKEYNRGLADGKASVEQKHGHWIRNAPNRKFMQEMKNLGFAKGMGVDSIFYTCSECNLWGSPYMKYCSHCGAKMDEVTEL